MAALEQREGLDMTGVLAGLKARAPAALAQAYVVGRWVWVGFDSMPSIEIRNTLKGLGFRWNHSRQVWQHPCGFYSRASVGDPRYRYGVVPAAEMVPEEMEVSA